MIINTSSCWKFAAYNLPIQGRRHEGTQCFLSPLPKYDWYYEDKEAFCCTTNRVKTDVVLRMASNLGSPPLSSLMGVWPSPPWAFLLRFPFESMMLNSIISCMESLHHFPLCPNLSPLFLLDNTFHYYIFSSWLVHERIRQLSKSPGSYWATY